VADLTRIPTGEGVLWLASVRDAFSNKVVGWATDARADTELVLTALNHALRSRNIQDGQPAAFAALCGVSPVEHSSGKTQRHRLNRGGDRTANSRLWTIANNRLLHDPRTRAYAERRTATGSSRKEILRLLKRYIAREVFTEIRRALAPPQSPSANT
jgi:transposase InsO family protein